MSVKFYKAHCNMCGKNSKIIQSSLVLLAATVYIVALVMGYLTERTSIFSGSDNEIANKYWQEVTPAAVIFAIIWPVIYIWNLVAILYIVVSLFLPQNKSPVKTEPTLIPISFLICHIIGFGSTIPWLFVFDRELLILAFFILVLSCCGMYGAFIISHKRVADNLDKLDTKECKTMLWLTRIFIHNGLGVVATWLTLATCINLSDIIIYKESPGSIVPEFRVDGFVDTSTGILALVFVIIIVYFVLDSFVFEKYTRYTFTVFPVFILALSGLIGKLRCVNGSAQNIIFTSVVLAFAVCLFLVRIALFIYRLKKRNAPVIDYDNIEIKEKV